VVKAELLISSWGDESLIRSGVDELLLGSWLDESLIGVVNIIQNYYLAPIILPYC
jgi:hypothetical protein